MKKLLLLAILMTACLGASAHRTGIYYYFDNIEKHVYEDENVRVFLYPTDDDKICVLVNNKTNRVLYVDNGSSFFYTNGRAASMYRARATTSGTMESSGTAVNLGGIASAFGARGPVVTALSAIVVSQSSGSYSGTIVSEKRIIPVAPMSTEAVYVEDFSISRVLEKTGKAIMFHKIYGDGTYRHSRLIEKGKKIKLNKGMERQYDENNTILSCKTLLKYSFTEDMSNAYEATADNYLKALVVDKNMKKDEYEYAQLSYCDKYRQSPEDYTLFSIKRDGLAMNPPVIFAIIPGILIAITVPLLLAL